MPTQLPLRFVLATVLLLNGFESWMVSMLVSDRIPNLAVAAIRGVVQSGDDADPRRSVSVNLLEAMSDI